MTHTSPTTFVVWSVMSTVLGAFLLGHLWRFDRFKCLKWSNTPYSGAFKRIMTYSYLITIPLIMIYSFGFAYIKYEEGFLDIGGTIFPKPYTFWSQEYRDAIFPLMMVFSFAWSFEMITHLEELCFWYFLITAGPSQPDWFHSPFFRVWIGGSLSAIIYLPVVTISYRHDPLACEARMFTAGSIGDLILTLAFIPILWRFPGFMRKVKAEGVDSSIIVRLRKFYELNVIRVIFRFLMQIPLLTLGVDGLTLHTHVNENMFWTDLLSTVAALGCAFSSVCTLLIFFPRSYEAEYKAKEASLQRSAYTLSSRDMHEPTQPTYSFHDSGEPPSFSNGGKSAMFHTQTGVASEMDVEYRSDEDSDENLKYESAERRMGKGMVKQPWSSRMRDRERKMVKGTRRVGAEISRRLASLKLPRSVSVRVRHGGTAESERAFVLPVEVPGLRAREMGECEIRRAINIEAEREREYTKRSTPIARSPARKKSAGERVTDGGEGAGLERKGTYLLTDSPVLRARRLREEEDARAAAGASAKIVEATAYAAAVGAGQSPSEMDMGEVRYGYGHRLGLSLDTCNPFIHNVERGRKADEDGDVDAFILDGSPLAMTLTTSPSGLPSISFSPTQSPTCEHGPRPVQKSSSMSTTATYHRALPTPPTDPLGAAPVYSPPEDPLSISVQVQGKGEGKEDDRWTRAPDREPHVMKGIGHPYATAVGYGYPSSGYLDKPDAANPHGVSTETSNTTTTTPVVHPTVVREVEVSEMPVSTPGVSIAPGFDNSANATGGERMHAGRLGRSRRAVGGGRREGRLTTANVSRHNTTTARSSQVNPIVHTFTSPIDFLDRGPGGSGENTQINYGWAV